MGTGEFPQSSGAERLCLICGGRFAASSRCPRDGTSLVPLNHEALVGQLVGGHYEVLGTLGRGGMSVVYKARHTLMKRVVALKVLTATDLYSVKRFHLEAELAAKLSHPNIVTVFDFGAAGDARPYLAMDFVDGETVSAAISRVGAFDFTRALPLFIQAADALGYAHAAGVIHRDLKPSNFMLVTVTNGERIKLLDFGIAKLLEPGEEHRNLTASGQVFGSPLYMSPEQCMGRKLDARADIYSLGCVMYEMLSGRPPFVGKTPVETMQLHVQMDALPINHWNANLDVPPELEAIVLRCLERDLSRRYKTVLELFDDLSSAQRRLESHAPQRSLAPSPPVPGSEIVNFDPSASKHETIDLTLPLPLQAIPSASEALRSVLGETEPPGNMHIDQIHPQLLETLEERRVSSSAAVPNVFTPVSLEKTLVLKRSGRRGLSPVLILIVVLVILLIVSVAANFARP